jgi:hypothetical protein
VWDRPEEGTKSIVMTGAGLTGRRKYVVDGTTGTWTKLRGHGEQIGDALRKEFSRCGFKPKNLKVIEVRRPVGPPNERGAFYLNLGYLRGLDPDEVWRLLHAVTVNGAGKTVRRFPDRCGHRKVFEALARLEQRVEAPPALMVMEPISKVAGSA